MSRGFLSSTGVVGGLTFVSRVTGLLRDRVYSHAFGAGPLMDAFLVAFKIPNFLRRLTAEGAFSQAFVPVVSEFKVRGTQEEMRQLVSGTAGTLGLALFVVTLIGVIAAPVLVMIFAPGFRDDGGRFDLTVDMLRLTFPYLFFISLVALASGVLNSYGRFAIPAFTPVLLNLVMIVFASLVAPHSDNPGLVLAAGVFVAGLVQLAVQVPALRSLGVLGRPRWAWDQEGVRRIGRLMLPGIFGSSVAQISLLLDTLIASFLMTGSIAWMYYADRLVEFPMGVFSIALATVILPGLSSHHASQSRAEFAGTLDWALRLAVIITLPAALGLAVLASPILVTLFQYDAFQMNDVAMSALSLSAYAAGLPAFIAVKVLAPGYYARQDPKTPVRIGLIAMGSNMVMNLLFVGGMLWAGWAGPHAGLALASSVAAYLNAGLLYRGLHRCGAYRPGPGWLRLLLSVGLASLAMASVLGAWMPGLEIWIALRATLRVADLVTYIALGTAVYGLVAWIAGLRPQQFVRGSH